MDNYRYLLSLPSELSQLKKEFLLIISRSFEKVFLFVKIFNKFLIKITEKDLLNQKEILTEILEKVPERSSQRSKNNSSNFEVIFEP